MEDYNSGYQIENEDFTNLLFSNPPQLANSVDFIVLNGDDKTDPDSTTFVFEMLLNIFIKGTIDGERLFEILKTNKPIKKTDDVTFINVYGINETQLEITKKWFYSIGYMLKVCEHTEPYQIQKYDYCKIYLRDNPQNKPFFTIKNIDKLYYFVLQSTYEQTNKLEDIKAIFYKPKNPQDSQDKNKVYTIGFEPIKRDCKINL